MCGVIRKSKAESFRYPESTYRRRDFEHAIEIAGNLNQCSMKKNQSFDCKNNVQLIRFIGYTINTKGYLLY